MRRRAALALAALALGAGVARADEVTEEAPVPVPPPAVRMLEEPPRYGQYYDRYEPTFYTGFAPRSLDPRRVHLHVGRGNQLRVTVVLSDETIASYARDLAARAATVRSLVDAGRIVLTQNDGFAAFEERLDEVDLGDLVKGEDGLSPEALRERNLELMEQLDPGRVFRVSIPEDALMRDWIARLTPADREHPGRERRLELANALLPTRLWRTELDAPTRAELSALVEAAPTAGALARGGVPEDFAVRWRALFDRLGEGLYPRRDGVVEFAEFTAIYPIGTFNEYTDYRGHRIPLYPTPGLRSLTTHQRTHTVDHIPTKVIYSFSPWIPYMHVGTALHNSFHTLWWSMDPEKTAFLPASWTRDERRLNGGPSHYLWLLSRGPMSHGCTHLTTGHINELRQLLPSETEKLYDVDVFLNKSYDYDVFDIDGDLEPEVMGVRYFIAYSLRNKKPHRLRVRDERRAYYDWLYGDEIGYRDDGSARLRDVRDGRFVGHTAVRGAHYDELELHEAAYEPERIQFYRLVDIDFARRLRQVSVFHPFDGPAAASP